MERATFLIEREKKRLHLRKEAKRRPENGSQAAGQSPFRRKKKKVLPRNLEKRDPG